MIASSIDALPVRAVLAAATPFIVSTATCVVMLPITIIRHPRGSSNGTPAPTAAATGTRASAGFRAPVKRTA